MSLVFSAAQNDAADLVAPVAPRRYDDLFAVFPAIEALNLPDVRLHACVLHFMNRLNHELGPELEIVGFFVALELVELRLLGWDQQFEHKKAAFSRLQILRQPAQASGLNTIYLPVALRVVAHQNFA